MHAGVLRDVATHFIVDARALKKAGGNHVKVHVISPSGTKTESYITDKGDGTYSVEYTAYEDGRRKILRHFLIVVGSTGTDLNRSEDIKRSPKTKKNPNLLPDEYRQTDGEINRRLSGQLLGIKEQREEWEEEKERGINTE